MAVLDCSFNPTQFGLDSTGGPSMVIIELARSRLGEAYVLGARVPFDDPNWHGPWDCAEFATWLVAQALGKRVGIRNGEAYTGFWEADAKRGIIKKVSVAAASNCPGSLLLRCPRKGVTGHIALVEGPNRTIEAHSRQRGVCYGKIAGRRWDMGLQL